MSFGWLGTFRQGSWQAFRKFVLQERRDVAERIAVIEAELIRIGEVTVLFNSITDNDGTRVTEERLGFLVSANSTLSKLLQVYVAMGGNPFDISLFLTPDSTVRVNPLDAEGLPTQPYNGVVYPKSAAYTTGQTYEGGFLAVKKYVPARTGGRVELEDSKEATYVDICRRWVNKEIRYKRNDIEARIIKQVDLKEQLQEELTQITWAVLGTVAAVPDLDEDAYDKDLTVGAAVARIDALFYVMDETNTPDFEEENTEALGSKKHLLSDLSPDEDNTAL